MDERTEDPWEPTKEFQMLEWLKDQCATRWGIDPELTAIVVTELISYMRTINSCEDFERICLQMHEYAKDKAKIDTHSLMPERFDGIHLKRQDYNHKAKESTDEEP